MTSYGHDVLRVPAMHKDGHTLSIAFTVAMLLAPDGKVSGIAAVMRDETSRFAEERALRKRLMELESQLPSQVKQTEPGAKTRRGVATNIGVELSTPNQDFFHEQSARRRSHPRFHPRPVRARPARSCWPGSAPT